MYTSISLASLFFVFVPINSDSFCLFCLRIEEITTSYIVCIFVEQFSFDKPNNKNLLFIIIAFVVYTTQIFPCMHAL